MQTTGAKSGPKYQAPEMAGLISQTSKEKEMRPTKITKMYTKSPRVKYNFVNCYNF
jgi:hypothetical protein